MEYLFVFSEGGWWLKLTEEDQVLDYIKKTNTRYEGALQMYMDWKQKGMEYEDVTQLPLTDRISLIENKDFKYMQAAIMEATKVGGNIFDGFRCLNMEIGMAYINTIKEYGAVYINRVGGKTFDVDYTQFCRRKSLVFPCYSLKDIRIKQFNGGTHYYAYLGDMQVRNGDETKWNTREAAYNAAAEIVEK